MFLWNYGAAGVNYYPLHNVFIRHSDVDGDRVFGSAGPVPPPRTLAYYAAHEIGHSLIGERIGVLANHRLPRWIREGLADYIGFGGQVDIDALTRALIADEREMNPQLTGLYDATVCWSRISSRAKAGASIACSSSNMAQEEAEQRLLAAAAAPRATRAGRRIRRVSPYMRRRKDISPQP